LTCKLHFRGTFEIIRDFVFVGDILRSNFAQECENLFRSRWRSSSLSSWIEFNNCPTRCDLFSLLHFCRQLYMLRVLTPIIRSSYNCIYSFWYWLTGSTIIHFRRWVRNLPHVWNNRPEKNSLVQNIFKKILFNLWMKCNLTPPDSRISSYYCSKEGLVVTNSWRLNYLKYVGK